MADGEHNDGLAPESPHVWQSLDRLSQLLGLTQKEVLDQIGRGIERLRIGGNTLLRVAVPEAEAASDLTDEEAAILANEPPDALDAQWETVLHEYREGLRERPHDLAPRAPVSARQEVESEADGEKASEEGAGRQILRSWSRFPGWFGPRFEPDEVPVR